MLDEKTLEWLEKRKSPYYFCKTYCGYFYEYEGSTKEEGSCMFPADSCFVRDKYTLEDNENEDDS